MTKNVYQFGNISELISVFRRIFSWKTQNVPVRVNSQIFQTFIWHIGLILKDISAICKKNLNFVQHFISQKDKFLGQCFPQKILTKLFALFEPKNVKNHVTLNFLAPPVMFFEFSV